MVPPSKTEGVAAQSRIEIIIHTHTHVCDAINAINHLEDSMLMQQVQHLWRALHICMQTRHVPMQPQQRQEAMCVQP